MATHSSILAWKIPLMEGPGRLQSMGLQKSDMTERLHFPIKNTSTWSSLCPIIYHYCQLVLELHQDISKENRHFSTLLPHSEELFYGSSDGKASACNAGDRVQFLGQEDPLEKEMAIHSSILAWKIPWTEEPDRLQSMGLQRVGYD